MIEDIKSIRSEVKDLRNFGIMIGTILFLVSTLLFLKGQDKYQIFAYAAGGFFAAGFITPILFWPFYMIWMIFATILGWFMTRVILSLLYYVLMTPIGMLSKFLGNDFLELKNNDNESYWNKRNKKSELNQDYEKQF